MVDRRFGIMRGITLIEVLVSMAILAVVAAAATPSFLRAVEGARFNAAARELANALKTARHEALTARHEATVVFDVEEFEYALTGRTRLLTLPAGSSLALVTAENERLDASRGAIRFFADGSSTGGALTLTYKNRSTTIEVDWLTGRVSFPN